MVLGGGLGAAVGEGMGEDWGWGLQWGRDGVGVCRGAGIGALRVPGQAGAQDVGAVQGAARHPATSPPGTWLPDSALLAAKPWCCLKPGQVFGAGGPSGLTSGCSPPPQGSPACLGERKQVTQPQTDAGRSHPAFGGQGYWGCPNPHICILPGFL